MSKEFPYTLTPPSKIINEVSRIANISIEEECIETNQKLLSRYSSKDVVAVMDIPPYDRALVDGYACRSQDILYASAESPVVLKLVDKDVINEGECKELNTGDKVPQGADIVVPREYTLRDKDSILVYNSLPPNYGIGLRGEDIRKGEVIIRRGERIRPWHIALASAQGFKCIYVYKLPRAIVFSTGMELLEPGEPYRDGMIYDSTRRLVLSYLKWMGFDVSDGGRVSDDIYMIEKMFRKLLSEYDIIFSTGGTSMGERDYTVKALKRLKPEYIVHGFAIKPGRPGAIAVVNGKIIMALSGFPVAALSELELVFKPLIEKLLNIRIDYPKIMGRLTRRIPSQPGITELYRVRIWIQNGEHFIEPLRLTGSGVLSTLIKGNAFLIVPEDSTGFEEGEKVEVHLVSW